MKATSAEMSGKKGWGIDLTVVKGITEALGGSVNAKPQENGTTLEVCLPKDSRLETDTGRELHQ